MMRFGNVSYDRESNAMNKQTAKTGSFCGSSSRSIAAVRSRHCFCLTRQDRGGDSI
jgi:hypothetical protein